MDFYLATPQGDVHLFSTEDGRVVEPQVISLPQGPNRAGAPPIASDGARPVEALAR